MDSQDYIVETVTSRVVDPFDYSLFTFYRT
jgi:hypothetical protein